MPFELAQMFFISFTFSMIFVIGMGSLEMIEEEVVEVEAMIA